MNDYLGPFVHAFARALESADHKCPVAVNARSGAPFSAGIGPHSESETIRLVISEPEIAGTDAYPGWRLNVPYPDRARQRCDLCLVGASGQIEWAIEAKLLRLLGDNGRPNDNLLMHILSPYPVHRSPVTDCVKLASSRLGNHAAVIIFGYECDEFPLNPAIRAFESLAKDQVRLSQRFEAPFTGLVHPVHRHGSVFGWEVFRS